MQISVTKNLCYKTNDILNYGREDAQYEALKRVK